MIQKQSNFAIFEGLQAMQHIDIPSAFNTAKDFVYGYHPSFGDMSAVSLAANAPNLPKWIRTAKESYKSYDTDKLPQRLAKAALDTGGQVLRDSEGWGNPIADGMSATYRNVRGVYDKQKEIGRKLTPKEVMQESGKAALQTAKAQIVTRPKMYFYDAPKMGIEAVKNATPKISQTISKLKSAFPRKRGLPQLASMHNSFTHFTNF